MTLADFIGIPYASHGRELSGLDCWGLVILAAQELYGLKLPDYAGYSDSCDGNQTALLFESRNLWQSVPLEDAQPGDVLVIKLAGYPVHAGLYLGADKMIHTLAGCNSCLVRIDNQTSWRRRIEGAYRWMANSY